jgi:hypothetical protein
MLSHPYPLAPGVVAYRQPPALSLEPGSRVRILDPLSQFCGETATVIECYSRGLFVELDRYAGRSVSLFFATAHLEAAEG